MHLFRCDPREQRHVLVKTANGSLQKSLEVFKYIPALTCLGKTSNNTPQHEQIGCSSIREITGQPWSDDAGRDDLIEHSQVRLAQFNYKVPLSPPLDLEAGGFPRGRLSKSRGC
jgi:hypothetical protein